MSQSEILLQEGRKKKIGDITDGSNLHKANMIVAHTKPSEWQILTTYGGLIMWILFNKPPYNNISGH